MGMVSQLPSRSGDRRHHQHPDDRSSDTQSKLLTCGNNEADPARRRIGFIVLLSQTTRAREDSNL